MTAELNPPVQMLPVPGTSSFLLLVHNTGNTEDSYTATIIGTSGPITATLSGLDGQPTTTVPLFRLPGLSTGALLLNTSLTDTGMGTVTVQVQSLHDGTISTSVVATVTAPALPHPLPPSPSHSVPLAVLVEVQVVRVGRRGKPTWLRLTFSAALDLASAQTLKDYTLSQGFKGKGKKRRLLTVPLRSATYDPNQHSVMLRLGKIKKPKRRSQLLVTGVLDSFGQLFDGDKDGLPGGTAMVPVALRFQPRRHH
jgi:hypothetical protein